MVTDRTAVMARLAHGSVSSDMHAPDKTELDSMDHFLNNAMKYSIANCLRDNVLQSVEDDFRAMKRILEDENRFA